MKTTITLLLFFIFQSLAGQTPTKKNYYKIVLTNNSHYTTICNIAGNERSDSANAQETKSILFELEDDQISFYLDVWTRDSFPSSYRSKRIRVLTTVNSKQIIVTGDNQIKYTLTSTEKVIDNFSPKYRSKNFWKLDTVIHNNPDNIAAADIIYISLCNTDVSVDTIKKYYDLLTLKVRSSGYGKMITNYLQARTRLTIGNKIDNFALKDTTGKIVQLNDIKSDYILLDFWFSRCVPCIQSFPDLQSLYSKTERKKFEILGISVDQKSENVLWRSTISKYNLPWLNITDPNYLIAKLFAIENYPTKILLDKNKKIMLVDTDNSYESFYKEIEKLVNGK